MKMIATLDKFFFYFDSVAFKNIIQQSWNFTELFFYIISLKTHIPTDKSSKKAWFQVTLHARIPTRDLKQYSWHVFLIINTD